MGRLRGAAGLRAAKQAAHRRVGTVALVVELEAALSFFVHFRANLTQKSLADSHPTSGHRQGQLDLRPEAAAERANREKLACPRGMTVEEASGESLEQSRLPRFVGSDKQIHTRRKAKPMRIPVAAPVEHADFFENQCST